ncbi:hypothetical protein DACRYDRAFT_25000 [Dacryopinax primogenitus]|uniref:Uncharacterized protein n=1 Tax=Dacryopinax primogenitus (strain DJM 731) TaxID=1858805 RepID=M5FNK9_DACPD|nr:uncharacterized protein DACRYDRAFT_25000 [Dacryopinax primogenitus]EJT97625.1 hypothetical protein DACRYDRAFT_25000 [Dacryopinax primogenitus]
MVYRNVLMWSDNGALNGNAPSVNNVSDKRSTASIREQKRYKERSSTSQTPDARLIAPKTDRSKGGQGGW